MKCSYLYVLLVYVTWRTANCIGNFNRYVPIG